MTGHLADRTAFVTAAGQGIGRSTALAFAAEGARVIATDIDESKVRQIATDSIRAARLDALHAADIAQAAIDAGPIDILFNCAGFVHHGTLLDATEAEWELAFDLNVGSMYRTMKAFLPGMLARGRGVIINMASVASSIKGVPNRFVYGATKAAVIGMTRSVAADFIRQGIRCNWICPGTVPRRASRNASRQCGAGRTGGRRRARPSSSASRWAGSAHPRRSPRSRSISPPMPRNSSPARPSSSTADSRCKGDKS